MGINFGHHSKISLICPISGELSAACPSLLGKERI